MSSSNRTELVALHAGFFLVGIVNTFLGALLPALSARWHLTDAQSGVILTLQSVGGMLGSAVNGWTLRKFGQRAVLISGYILLAFAVTAFAFVSWELGLICSLVSGIALGLVIPTTTVLISAAYRERGAAALNILNLFWGAGAFVAPLFIAAFLRAQRMAGIFFLLAAGLLGLAFWLSLTLKTRSAINAESVTPLAAAVPARSIFSSGTMIFCAAAFFYVGTEAAFGGWIATHAQRATTAQSTFFSWSLLTALFWFGLLSGRTSAPLFLRHWRELQLVRCGIGLAAFGQIIVLANAAQTATAAGIFMTGFGLAPIFPTLLALFAKRASATDAARYTGMIFLCAGLGGATFPGLVGLIATATGNLQTALLLPLLTLFALLLLLRGKRQRQLREESN